MQMIIAPHFSLLCLCDHYASAVFRLRLGVRTFNMRVEWPVLLQLNELNVTSLYAFLAYRFRKFTRASIDQYIYDILVRPRAQNIQFPGRSQT